jgi:kynureninase
MPDHSYMDQVVVEKGDGSMEFASNDPLVDILKHMKDASAIDQASSLDDRDSLGYLKQSFTFPRRNGQEVIYFVGNSLGLQPSSCRDRVISELESWSSLGVNGHFEGPMPWLDYDTDNLVGGMARLVGAKPSELAVMNSLTVNLHLLLIRFLGKVTSPENSGIRRDKILVESKLFPSDFYAIESQLKLHGLYDSDESNIVYVTPRPGEHCLRTEDIENKIAELGDRLALVVFPGVQYYTGQLFDICAITRAAHSVGAKAIWDLAHAAGNVDMRLHDWGVDGACWCTYKYLNSGPGGIGGFFIHEKHFNDVHAHRLAGWWSHNVSTRFEMSNEYDPSIGASEFRLSNVPILSSAALLASLDVFEKTDMKTLRAKSILLTGFLEKLLLKLNKELGGTCFDIITNKSRGAQLSLLFKSDTQAKQVNGELEKAGVMVDYRKPGLIRAAPAPLYCSFKDVVIFCEKLKLAILGCS